MDATNQLSIKLYLQTQVISGYLHNPANERLTNILSRIAVRRPESRAVFLQLSEVTVQHGDGREETLPSAYISKTAIEMATTLEADSGRGLGAEPRSRLYPFVEKSAVRVRLRTPGYVIAGNLYRAAHQMVWQVLEETLTFLPLTDAEIGALANGDRWNAPFVAVNKERTILLSEETPIS